MINIQVDTGFNKSFNWVINSGIYFIGYLTESELSIEDVFEFLSTHDDTKTLIDYISNLKGNYSIIIDKKDTLLLFSDIIRSFPLYYTLTKDKVIVTDNPFHQISDVNSFSKNSLEYSEYKLSGFVLDDKTLHPNFFQLEAGEAITIDKMTLSFQSHKVFKFWHSEFYNQPIDKLISNLDNVYIDVFKRLIKSLNNRYVIIPLSGGLDSRLVATMFRRLNYKNVICFTYGNRNSFEASIAKAVAQKLGYPWYFIEYTDRKWKEWFENPKFYEIMKYASGVTSIYHVQQTIALMELKKLTDIPCDSIFVPGHSDIICGSHIPHYLEYQSTVTTPKIINYIIEHHLSLSRIKKSKLKQIKNNLRYSFSSKDYLDSEEAANIVECFDWKERQAKFIVNDVRNYEFFGYQWRLPLWDKNAVEFWMHIPVNLRINRNLFFEYTCEYINSYLDIDFSTLKSPKPTSTIKKFSKRIGLSEIKPFKISHAYFRTILSYKTNPVNFYGPMSFFKYLKLVIKLGPYFNINSLMIQKYLDKNNAL